MKIEQKADVKAAKARYCLNPYSNGMKIERPASLQQGQPQSVLILILME